MENGYCFPNGFKWGVATASYQIEGAIDEDGRGESIWDRFDTIPGNIKDGTNGHTACDYYHRWREDVKNMVAIGIKAYRFSIAWSRILPAGTGKVNPKGIEFYSTIIDELISQGIEPVVTIFHWDTPQKLQDRGGWMNRECAEWYRDYCKILFEAFGGRVRQWISLNEPWISSFGGHYLGQFAPGYRDFSAALTAAHNLLRGHGMAVRLFREMGLPGEIGITLNLSPKEPYCNTEQDSCAATINDGYMNRWFLDPVFKGFYPKDMLEFYKEKGVKLPDIEDGDMSLISTPIDFLGVNYYNIDFTQKDDSVWPLELSVKTDITQYRTTNYGWPIVEHGLTDLLIRLKCQYGNPKIYITENGASFLDVMNCKGEVLDDCRIDYIERHIIACRKAIARGVDLKGYFVWTLIDDFEWDTGFSNCFGLVYMDRTTKNRTIKKSGYWYKTIIEKNGIY